MAENVPVTAYVGNYDTPLEILDYPGNRPAGSFLTDGVNVHSVPDTVSEFQITANNLLADYGVKSLEERIPVLAYGANASPPKLRKKMLHFGESVPDLQIVPHITATVPGNLAVWHGRLGLAGSVFAELYKSDETDSLQAHVAYLTKEQLAKIHISEGVTYTAAEIPVEIGTAHDSKTITAIAYVALQGSVLLANGNPALPSRIMNKADEHVRMDAETAVDYMLGSVAETEAPTTCRDYLQEGMTLDQQARKHRQLKVGQQLVAAGVSQPYVYPLEPGQAIGRADFSSLPNGGSHDLLTIPEDALQAIRPAEEQLTASVNKQCAAKPEMSQTAARIKAIELLDPARKLSRRAHEELAIQLQSS